MQAQAAFLHEQARDRSPVTVSRQRSPAYPSKRLTVRDGADAKLPCSRATRRELWRLFKSELEEVLMANRSSRLETEILALSLSPRTGEGQRELNTLPNPCFCDNARGEGDGFSG